MRYCLALDLKNDPALIAEYEQHHAQIWPEIAQSIYNSGIMEMEIYRIENRLVMVIETAADFSFDRKGQMDAQNPQVQAWEALMWNYQQALPTAQTGEKWLLMKNIFKLEKQ